MVTRRRLHMGLLMATLLIGLVICWTVWRAMTPEPVRAYERLRLGMTLKDVEQAIGAPAGFEYAPFAWGDATLIRESGMPLADMQDVWPGGFATAKAGFKAS